MTTTLHFWGGAGTVTGSNFMLESEGTKILVDCGLIQGGSYVENGNYTPFPYTPAEVSVLLVTHAHIDHIGRIPKLVKDGFRGKIISTEATRALAEPLLMDSMELLAHAAEKAGKPQLYDEKDVAQALSLWEGVQYHSALELPGGFRATLLDAGHILGSAMVEIVRGGRKIVFTGDLGNDRSSLVGPTEVVSDMHYLVMESVYGDRKHEDIDNRVERLEDIIESTAARGGTLLIPAFSTERTQDLVFEIRTLFMDKKVPSIPVYVDSPLARTITDAFSAHPEYFKDDIRARIEKGEHIFEFSELSFVHTAEESRELHKNTGPQIIIAGSGMSQGGRVLSHETQYLKDPKSTLLIVGYQSAGSLGRALIEGVREVTIHKEKIAVKARIEELYGYSAHRDSEGLSSFVHASAPTLEGVFVTMGEPKSSLFLVQHIRDFIGLPATAPEAGASVQLSL